MKPEELQAMQESGAVQLSRTGVTHVAIPANPEAFVERAEPGTGNVEFDVPSEQVQAYGNGWGRIIGPGDDIYNRYRIAQGLPGFTSMPAFRNLTDWFAMRW